MSYQVGTTNFNLPQTTASDKRDWSDTNQAFAEVDAALYQAGQDATTAIGAAQTAQTAADGALVAAQGAVTTANGAASVAEAASETAQLANTAAQAAQNTADGAVTTAGQAQTTAQAAQTTATNADTVALAAQSAVGNLSNLTTTDKSSAVAAINEINSDLEDLAGKVVNKMFNITIQKVPSTGFSIDISGLDDTHYLVMSTGSSITSGSGNVYKGLISTIKGGSTITLATGNQAISITCTAAGILTVSALDNYNNIGFSMLETIS